MLHTDTTYVIRAFSEVPAPAKDRHTTWIAATPLYMSLIAVCGSIPMIGSGLSCRRQSVVQEDYARPPQLRPLSRRCPGLTFFDRTVCVKRQ